MAEKGRETDISIVSAKKKGLKYELKVAILCSNFCVINNHHIFVINCQILFIKRLILKSNKQLQRNSALYKNIVFIK